MMKFKTENITLSAFLSKVRDEVVRSDSDTQRYMEVWKDPMAPSLLVLSPLRGMWIPSFMIAEEPLKAITQQWIGDGNQRCGYLMKFRYANMRLKKNIPNGVVEYSAQVRDENGNLKRDEEGSIVWELRTFDISNHTYDELPKELQQRFDNYTISLVIYEDCDKKEIAELLRIYNNTSSMNNEQKALTHIEKFARTIKEIESEGMMNNIYSLSSKKSGKVQRLVMEICGLTFHMKNWKKNAIELAKFINENATMEEFAAIAEMNRRLEEVVDTEELEKIFSFKNAGLLFAVFHKFMSYGLEDEKFAEFLMEFVKSLQHEKTNVSYKDSDNVAFSDMDVSYCNKEINSSTYRTSKDTSMMKAKYDVLVYLMEQYFGIEKEEVVEDVEESVVVENAATEDTVLSKEFDIKMHCDTVKCQGFNKAGNKEITESAFKLCNTITGDTTEEDMIKYLETLDFISLNTDMDSDFYTIENIVATLGMISAVVDVDRFCEWFEGYVENYTYKERTYKEAYEDMMSKYDLYLVKAA